MQKLNIGDVSTSAHGMRPSEVLNEISIITHAAISEQYRILNEDILPALALEDIRYLKRDELNAEQSAWMKRYFTEQVVPVLTPISIDPAHPFPRLVNKSLNFIATLEGKDAFGRDINLAIVPAPRSLPRVIRLPDELTGGKEHHVMLSAIIHEHIGELFPGMSVTGCHQFRLTRNADLDLADDVEDIAKALEGELENRRFGDKVRLEVTTDCPTHISEYLLNEFELHDNQLYRVNGPVNLTRLLFDFNIPALRYQHLLMSCQRHSAEKWISQINRPVCSLPCVKAMCWFIILFMPFLRLLIYFGKRPAIPKYWQLNKLYIVQAPIQKSSKHLLPPLVMAKKSRLLLNCVRVLMKRLISQLLTIYKKQARSWSTVSSVTRPMPSSC